MTKKIRIEKVSRQFKLENTFIQVINDFSYDFNSEEKHCIMGASGSGKTTLINIIGAFDLGYTGNVYIDGMDIKGLSSKEISTLRRESIGYIFQDYQLLENKNVMTNIELPLLYVGMKKKERRKRIFDILDKVNLKNKSKVKAKYLSGGERQRVAIARALIMNPSIVLADEITSSLDDKNAEIIIELILSFLKHDSVFIFVTHDNRVTKYFDNIIEM